MTCINLQTLWCMAEKGGKFENATGVMGLKAGKQDNCRELHWIKRYCDIMEVSLFL